MSNIEINEVSAQLARVCAGGYRFAGAADDGAPKRELAAALLFALDDLADIAGGREILNLVLIEKAGLLVGSAQRSGESAGWLKAFEKGRADALAL